MIWALYLLIVLIVLTLFVVISRKKKPQTTPTSFELPAIIDREDFEDKKADILVLVFTSQHCDGCGVMFDKAKVLQSDSVDVVDVSYQDKHGKEVHDKYQIEAVPSIVICDNEGNTQKTFVGAVTATDLWAAVAELRGATINHCDSH